MANTAVAPATISEEVLAEIKYQLAQIIARQFAQDDQAITQDDSQTNPKPLAIRGTEGMVVSFARCCRPIPGDAIVGHLSSGRGIVIHTDDCHNVGDYESKPEKYLPVVWSDKVEGEFLVEIRVELANQRGALALIATTITDSDANVESINMEEKNANYGVIKLLIAVRHRVHLARIIKRLRNLKTVAKITRSKA
ncbi:MAG TPA: ACT domain-containing protein [Pseudomonadales bacterium]|nr:ACT domain-containing protein [Pseudomonadales bacterium]